MNESQIAEEGRRTAQEMKEAAQEWAGKAKGTAQEWKERAREKAREAGAVADSYVHENAWTSVAIVAVVAGVLGYLLGSSRR